MTAAAPVAVPTTIDHLDFAPRCGFIHHHSQDKCPHTAAWWVLGLPHCAGPDGTPRDGFACQGHIERVMDGDLFICGTCKEPYEVRPTIIRTERIR